MSRKFDVTSLGVVQGNEVVGRRGFFAYYGIEFVKESQEGINSPMVIRVCYHNNRSHYFWSIDPSRSFLLAEYFSRVMQTEAEVYHGLHMLVRYHRGQMVIGHRPLRYFVPSCSEEENNLTVLR